LYYIIETSSQLEKFKSYDLSSCIVDVVPYSDNYHPILSSPSLVYIRPFKSRAGFILPINHSESINLPYEEVSALINNNIGNIYAVDSKRLHYFVKLNKVAYCLKTAYYLKKGKAFVESEYDTPAHHFLYQRNYSTYDVNRIIPISKHFEKLEGVSTELKGYLKIIENPYYHLYGITAINTFFRIETKGIKLDVNEHKKHFNFKNSEFSLHEGRAYSMYNLFTSTGRPSNAFNGVNFAALSKEDNSRKSIISSNDYLVEFDYSSYHLKILSKIINYTFEEEDIHRHIGKFYYEKESLTNEEYAESKQLTFRLLYTDSNVEEISKIPFFQKVREFKKELWDKYKIEGFIESFYSKRPIKNIESKTQLLPYVLQNYETERNIEVLSKLITLLKKRKTKLILYCYDSFLFDFCKEEGKDLLYIISDILEDGGYKTTCRYGKNYADMKNI
jgi:hypothetical protein